MSRSQGNRFITILCVVVLAGGFLYVGFMAVDGLWLKKQTATATVVGKGYREAGQTYYTQIIGNRPVVRAQETAEAYVLKVDIGGREIECVVAREVHDAVSAGDQVEVTYQESRLSRTVLVQDVSP